VSISKHSKVFSQKYPPHPEEKKIVLQVLREAQHLQNDQKNFWGAGRNPSKRLLNSPVCWMSIVDASARNAYNILSC